MTRDRVSAVILLLFSVGYGWMSTSIQMFAGAEADPFTPQTLPRTLAAMGTLLAIGLFVFGGSGKGGQSFRSAFAGLDWGKSLQLLVLMVLFAVAIEWLGFVIASALFLAGGFWVLGIRRWRTIALGSLPLSVGFWLILAKLLDIYLSPGELWFMLGVVQ